MAELLILDPAAVATDRAELDITPFVGPDGPDFGDAQIEAYLAERERGQVPIDHRVPNRQIVIPLMLTDRDGTSFADIRRRIQAKVGLFQAEGGWVARESAEGPVYADVVNASLKLGARNTAAWGFADADAVLTLECLPEWYGDEVALDAISETSLPEITGVLEEGGQPAVIRGDVPARCRIVVTDDQGVDQGAVIAAFRSRHYSADATAALAYEAEDLTPLGSAAIATLSGASGGGSNNTVRHTSLGTAWTPVLGTTIDSSSSELTHTGSYRVLARVQSPDGSAVSVRLAWAVGDLNNPNTNPGWRISGTSAWELADLGQVRLDRGLAGSHRWLGRIEARGTASGEDIYIDRIWLVPLDDGAVQATTINPLGSDPPAIATDLFEQTSGNLNGKTATSGGTWATSGATTDFTVNTTNHVAERSTTSDASPRLAVLGSTSLSGVLARLDVKTSGQHGLQGLLLRYVDANNYLAVLAYPFVNSRRLTVWQVISGSTTALADVLLDGSRPTTDWIHLRAIVYANGTVNVWGTMNDAFTSAPQIATSSSALGANGTLSTGKFGMIDYNPGPTATRQFDNFYVAAISTVPSAAIYADQTIELGTLGVTRATADGDAYAPPPSITGRLPRLPVSGLEERPVELFVKTSRGDLAQLPDAGIDDITAQVFYRPTYLFLPDEDGS